MTPMHAILALSSFAWAYAIVLAVVWFRAVARTDIRDHIGHFTTLMGVFVPGIALVLVTLLVGAIFQIAWLFALLVLAFPATIATGLHLEVATLTEPDPWAEAQRLILTVLLALLLTSHALS